MPSDKYSLDGLDGYMFEELVAKIMKRRGFKNVQVTQKSRDTGKDILMEADDGNIVIVECKHQKSVGRPIVQKLQGAMNHESEKRRGSIVAGMVVTSGNFSNEAIEYVKEIGQKVELIDGRRLKAICKELGMIITNGKVQIISNKSYPNITASESSDYTKYCYSKIYGHDYFVPKIQTACSYEPLCYVEYQVAFDTYTSIGLIDSYSSSGELIIDGRKGKFVNGSLFRLYVQNVGLDELISDSTLDKVSQYEFTENELDERITTQIIQTHRHTVGYSGRNNISYYKDCVPLKKDIQVVDFKSLYAPVWESSAEIGEFSYSQTFCVNKNNKIVVTDGLLICKICNEKHNNHSELFLCHKCGHIVCEKHHKIDHWDKVTPVCEVHCQSMKVFLQPKYFAKTETRNEYEKWLVSKNIFVKIFEDKYVFYSLCCFVFAVFVYLIIQFNLTS